MEKLKEITRDMTLSTATELNILLGLEPEIDINLPDDKLTIDICEAAEEILVDDEVTTETKIILFSMGANLPLEWINEDELKVNDIKKKKEVVKKISKKGVKEVVKKISKKGVKEVSVKDKMVDDITNESVPVKTKSVNKNEKEILTNSTNKDNNKVNRKDLLIALNKVKPALTPSDINPFSSHLIFNQDYVWAYDGSILITQAIPNIGISGAVKPNEFCALLSKMNDENINVGNDENAINVSGKSIKANIFINMNIPPEGMKVPEESEKWMELPDNFCDSLSVCLFDRHFEIRSPALDFIRVKGNEIISCDGIVGAKKELSKKVDVDFYISYAHAKKLSKYNVNKYIVSDGYTCFKTSDGTVFCCREVDTTHSDLVNTLFENVDGIKLDEVDSILKALDSVSPMTMSVNKQDKKVEFYCEGKGKAFFRGEGTGGIVTNEIDIKSTSKFDVSISPILLPKNIKFDQIVIREKSMMFKGDGIKYIVFLREAG